MNNHFSRKRHLKSDEFVVSGEVPIYSREIYFQWLSLLLQGDTPLHSAAGEGHVTVVQELIRAGCSPTEKNTKVYT